MLNFPQTKLTLLMADNKDSLVLQVSYFYAWGENSLKGGLVWEGRRLTSHSTWDQGFFHQLHRGGVTDPS